MKAEYRRKYGYFSTKIAVGLFLLFGIMQFSYIHSTLFLPMEQKATGLLGLDCDWRDWGIYRMLCWLLPQLSIVFLYGMGLEQRMQGNQYMVLHRIGSRKKWWRLLEQELWITVLFFVTLITALNVGCVFVTEKSLDIEWILSNVLPAIVCYTLQIICYLQIQLCMAVVWNNWKIPMLIILVLVVTGMYSGAELGQYHYLLPGSAGMWVRYENCRSMGSIVTGIVILLVINVCLYFLGEKGLKRS